MTTHRAACILCGADDAPLIDVCGELLCVPCEAFERTFDIDAYESDRRQRIAEQNEY